MNPFIVAVALASAEPAVAAPLSEAANAIEAGRLEQARLMISDAVKAGAAGEAVDRLLADLAFASGDYTAALARYTSLLVSDPSETRLNELAGISALHLRKIPAAVVLLDRATSSASASWRAWSGRGIAADFEGDWRTADAAYARAAALAPHSAEVLNNRGWSLLVRGKWEEALALFERAAALDPRSKRIAHNLELAQSATAEDLPRRHLHESESDWAARLNDAGVIAKLRGDRRRAIAAFSRALEARTEWYDRAAANLAWAEGDK